MSAINKPFGWSKSESFWLISAVFTLLLRALLPAQWIEVGYTRGLYPWIRKFMEGLHWLIPVHWLWVVIIFLIVFIVRNCYLSLQYPGSPLYRIGRILRRTLSLLAMVFTLFMWCWGFNYGRTNLYQQLEIQGKSIPLEQLIRLANNQQDKIIGLRAMASTLPDSLAQAVYQLPEQMETDILEATKSTFKTLKLGVLASPKPKLLRPKGTLLRINTAGFYSPWTGEPNIDAGLHPLQIPFVMAHEISHSMGITDEGGCNFLAVLIGRKMKEPTLRYAFELSYWKYIMGKLRRQSKDDYQNLRDQLPGEIVNDLKNIRENSERYPDIFPKLRNLFYDSYLKSQGVKEGMGSYRQVVNMIVAWDEKLNAN